MELTNNEKAFLKAQIRGARFNSDSIDLDKSYEEQEWECDNYYDIMDCVWIRRCVPEFKDLNNQAIRAIFGSLIKKGLVTDSEDEDGDGKPMTWIVIGKEEFENLKAIKDQLI